jgi:hypothetical protein
MARGFSHNRDELSIGAHHDHCCNPFFESEDGEIGLPTPAIL